MPNYTHQSEYEKAAYEGPQRRTQRPMDVEKYEPRSPRHSPSTSSSSIAYNLRSRSNPKQWQDRPANSPPSPTLDQTHYTLAGREMPAKEKPRSLPLQDPVPRRISTGSSKKSQTLAQGIPRSTAQVVHKSAPIGQSLRTNKDDHSAATLATLPTDPPHVARHGRGAEAESMLQIPASENEVVSSLIAAVGRGDYATFGLLITEDLDLINGDEALAAIVQQRKEYLETNMPQGADNCLKTATLIKELRGLSYAPATYFLRSLILDNDEWVLRDFHEACDREKQSLDGQTVTSRQETEKTKPVAARTAPSKRREARSPNKAFRTARTASSQVGAYSRIRDFQEQPSKWFVKGKFFKAWKPSPLHDDRSRTPRPEVIYLFLVIEGYSDHCVVMQARSYGQRGRRRSTVKPSEVHAAPASHKTPSLRPRGKGKQAMEKRIMINMSSGAENIDAETWIDFSNAIPLRTPLGAKEIGNVDKSSMADLEHYWKQHSLR